ncbi:hypothetical protein PanWU01x14_148560 [Parasponia andersonii]|uniref:Uncharacterized protein n=1 Tax=Parasponia andersonii TaxID=3476 RepID=A0A2P5CJ46_PARAD|nr:hypothetical protein PanWU01x14_148560 [Parasponia andersonii]
MSSLGLRSSRSSRGLPSYLSLSTVSLRMLNATKMQRKADKEASTCKEIEGQLRKELESLQAKVEANTAYARGKAMADFKNWQEFLDLYFRGFIDCHLEAMGLESYNAMMVMATGSEPPSGENQEGVKNTARGGDGGEAGERFRFAFMASAQTGRLECIFTSSSQIERLSYAFATSGRMKSLNVFCSLESNRRALMCLRDLKSDEGLKCSFVTSRRLRGLEFAFTASGQTKGLNMPS